MTNWKAISATTAAFLSIASLMGLVFAAGIHYEKVHSELRDYERSLSILNDNNQELLDLVEENAKQIQKLINSGPPFHRVHYDDIWDRSYRQWINNPDSFWLAPSQKN